MGPTDSEKERETITPEPGHWDGQLDVSHHSTLHLEQKNMVNKYPVLKQWLGSGRGEDPDLAGNKYGS